MEKFLYKVGSWSYRKSWPIVVGWLAIIGCLGLLAAHFMRPMNSAITIPGTEGQVTLDTFKKTFPDSSSSSARVVFQTPQGKTIDSYKSEVGRVVDKVSHQKGITLVVSPFDNPTAINKDRTIAYIQIQFNVDASGNVPKDIQQTILQAADSVRGNGLTVETGGDISREEPGQILGIGEVSGVFVALIVLIITLASLVAAGLPIIVALVTVGTSMAGLYALSGIITGTSVTPVLAVMLGLAVGIDYSLFIVNRYRTYLLEGYSYKEAAASAVSVAGSAVVFAASTVVIALAALSVVQIPFITTMGLVAAATVAVAALVAVTLLPALLGIVGAHIFGRKTRRKVTALQQRGAKDVHNIKHSQVWYKWGSALTRHPIWVMVVTVLVVAVIALPVTKLQMSLPSDKYAAKDSTERKAYDLLTKGFGAGFNGPLLVLVQHLPAVSDADKAAVRNQAMEVYNQKIAEGEATAKAQFEKQAAAVRTPEEAAALQQAQAAAQAQAEAQEQAGLQQIDQTVEQQAKLVQLSKVASAIKKHSSGVDQALPALATNDGTTGVIQVIPTSGPTDQATVQLIKDLRIRSTQTKLAKNSAVTFGVTGTTAIELDIDKKLADALPVYLAVVVGLSFILLLIAFRSVLVPIKATLGFLLSVLAMLGAAVAVFQWGWFGITSTPGPIMSFLPIIAIGILFGLSMDYEFFLVSSMHEEYQRTKRAKQSVINGFAIGSRVVVAAAIIMISVFAGFIGNGDSTVQTIGFSLAFGIFIDAFIVRMTIVPAVMTLFGDSAWWLPNWLRRLFHEAKAK